LAVILTVLKRRKRQPMRLEIRHLKRHQKRRARVQHRIVSLIAFAYTLGNNTTTGIQCLARAQAGNHNIGLPMGDLGISCLKTSINQAGLSNSFIW
jgi:hypothetical protein